MLGGRQIVLCERDHEQLCKGQITLSSLDAKAQEDETAPRKTDCLINTKKININLERRLSWYRLEAALFNFYVSGLIRQG